MFGGGARYPVPIETLGMPSPRAAIRAHGAQSAITREMSHWRITPCHHPMLSRRISGLRKPMSPMNSPQVDVTGFPRAFLYSREMGSHGPWTGLQRPDSSSLKSSRHRAASNENRSRTASATVRSDTTWPRPAPPSQASRAPSIRRYRFLAATMVAATKGRARSMAGEAGKGGLRWQSAVPSIGRMAGQAVSTRLTKYTLTFSPSFDRLRAGRGGIFAATRTSPSVFRP